MRRPARGATLDEIESIYRTRLPEFRRVAAAIVGDRELALDAVQEGFAHAVRERTSFRGEGPLEGWLWRIVVNAARGQRRRRVDRGGLLDERSERNGSPSEPEARVRAAVALLPERQRLVLFLRYYADLDYGAIADALGISTGTVGATLSTAHAAMSRLLEDVPR
jgi:RNA polymerase sigma-70 factor (ECF subfamily)